MMIKKGFDYTSELDSYYLNQQLDDIEATVADRKDKALLDKIIDFRRELDKYYDTAVEHAEILNDIRDCLI